MNNHECLFSFSNDINDVPSQESIPAKSLRENEASQKDTENAEAAENEGAAGGLDDVIGKPDE